MSLLYSATLRNAASAFAISFTLVGMVAAVPAKAATFQTIFSVCPDFPTCSLGANPRSGLVLDSTGKLYGTAPAGGTGFGTVFQLTPPGSKWTSKLVYAFCSLSNCDDGVFPESALIVDTAANLYGVTPQGGANGAGTAFKLSPVGNSWQLSVLYAFCGQGGSACTDGKTPSGTTTGSSVGLTYFGAATGQLYDGTSALYGTTISGGAHNSGAVFQLTNNAGTWTEKLLYSFCAQDGCADGSSPGNLLVSASNLMYGTTGSGSVFQLKQNVKGKWKFHTVYNFCSVANCADGAGPNSLGINAAGTLLGTTVSGGTSANCDISGGCGVAFKLVPKKKNPVESVLYNLCSQPGCSDGSQPVPGIAVDTAGNLYGASNLGGNDTCFGGSTCGTVFEVQGTTEQMLHAFCPQGDCIEGTSPQAGPIRDSSGNVFGTTAFGGKFGVGSVYEITP